MTMSGHRYTSSTNPFDQDDDVDDETFLKNSRRTNGYQQPSSSLDEQIQSLQEKRKMIEERTLNSTERSIGLLRDSEQIGIATAEELSRQREKLEKTDKQLDEINATLRFSQKHINGIKSVFSSLKNYMSGKNGESTPTSSSTSSVAKEQPKPSDLDGKLASYDRYENHPTTRLRGTDYTVNQTESYASGGSKDFSSKLDANLKEMYSNISVLKGLATDLSYEIESQNDLIDNITNKAEIADLTINKQNKEINRLLKK